MVAVARGWGDWRRLQVDETVLFDFHMATCAGGTQRNLPRPTLAAYMSCDAIPDGVEFGHSCRHGPAPHQIKVLIFKSHNDRAVYERLHVQIRG